MADLGTTESADTSPNERSEPSRLALVLLYSVHEPQRSGEIAWLAGQPLSLGREAMVFLRQRPAENTETGPLTDPALSRHQLSLQPLSGRTLKVQRTGRLPLRVGGVPVDEAVIGTGDLLEIGERAVLLVTQRPERLPGERPQHAFGEPDQSGIVGESAAVWALRARIAFVAERRDHVLVTGESGTGKELVARALHQGSRRRGPFVSRSAATIPESLADAELFGNLGNYPNPGTPARPGLVGEADGGTLLLDEFGELPIELQARLLRVLDAGEYTRLGEARPRKTDLRLVAATNRQPSELKHDVLARLPFRITAPPLQQRPEDIGLLVLHLLRQIALADPAIGERLGHPPVTTRLVAALAVHPYRTHIRELYAILWQAIAECEVPPLDLFPGYKALLETPSARSLGPTDPSRLDPALVQAALDRHGGRQEPVWRELGLANRYVLTRFVKRHHLKVRGRGDG